MSSAVSDRVSDLLREVGATAIMPRFAALGSGDTAWKAGDEPVTVADRQAEAMISGVRPALLQGRRVVGEEACSARPELLQGLHEGIVWVVDPIDGTANFAAGRAPFAIMIALLREGETVQSWIFDPLSGRLAVAEAGGGCWIDGERVQGDQAPVPAARLHGIVSTAFVPPDRMNMVELLAGAVADTVETVRCAGHEYPLVATGERDFALYWRTRVWDHAPGALLLTEAGGSVTHLDGSPYRPAVPKSGLLLARNPAIGKTLLELLKGAGSA